MISSYLMLIYPTLCLFGYASLVLILLFFCNEVEFDPGYTSLSMSLVQLGSHGSKLQSNDDCLYCKFADISHSSLCSACSDFPES